MSQSKYVVINPYESPVSQRTNGGTNFMRHAGIDARSISTLSTHMWNHGCVFPWSRKTSVAKHMQPICSCCMIQHVRALSNTAHIRNVWSQENAMCDPGIIGNIRVYNSLISLMVLWELFCELSYQLMLYDNVIEIQLLFWFMLNFSLLFSFFRFVIPYFR